MIALNQVFVILTFTIHLLAQSDDLHVAKLNKQPRQLSNCQKNCNICDDDGSCIQCGDLRVFPDCSCQAGYFENQGSCSQCKPGCMQCTTANDCQTCYSIYTYNQQTTNCDCNIPNVEGCENQSTGNLIYYTRFNSDYRSYTVVFNQMISLNGITFDQAIVGSQQNCQSIIDKVTLDMYTKDYLVGYMYPTCQIDPLKRNEFIIYMSTVVTSVYSFVQPTFILANIFVNINQNTIAATQLYQKESQVGVQQNTRAKLCSFRLNNYVYQYSSNNQVVATVYFIDQSMYQSISLDSVTIISPSKYSNIQLASQVFGTKGYQILFNSDPQIQDTITISAQCSLSKLKITTVHTTTVQISSSLPTTPYSIDLPNSAGNTQLSNQDFSTSITLQNFPQISNYQISVSFYPQIMQNQIIQCNSFTTQYAITIPSYSVKQSSIIYLLYRIYDNTGIIRARGDFTVFSLPYQFIGTTSYTPVVLTKLNPTSDIQISQDISQFQLAQSKYFNPYYYIQYWFCLDSKGNACVDKLNKPLKLTQNGSNIVEISKYSLPLNTQYTVYYQLMSQNFPFSKQYATFQIDTGQSYPYALVQGIIPSPIKIVQVNLQDVVYVNIQLHTDFPYRIVFAQFTITLGYNSVQHSLVQISNQFSFILEDYFPTPDFTQTVSVSLQYQIYDQILQQSIPIPSGNQPSVIYVRAPPTQISLNINQQPYVSFQDKITIAFNPTDNQKLYQFFYYNNITEFQQEIQFPLQPKRKMLSAQSAVQSISSFLPAGNIVVIGVLFDPSTYQYTNVTQTVVINNNNLNEQQYLDFIQTQMTAAQSYQTQNQFINEIFTYQTIIAVVEQYEVTSNSPQQANQVKIQILERLMQSQWNQQFDDSYILSNQIIFRLMSSQLKIDTNSQLFSQLIQYSKTRIQQLHNKIQQIFFSLTTYQINYFRQSLLDIANTYMMLVKLNKNLQIINDSDTVQFTNLIMNGFLYLLSTNQSPIDFPTPQASLRIENNDLLMFYNNYYTQIAQTLDPFSSSSYNLYVTISTWQNSTYLYRDELPQINQQYLSKVNSTVQELLKRTYPIKIPCVYSNDVQNQTSNRLRQLQSQPVNVTSNFTLDFGTISPEEKLQCIQRSSSGRWVHNSCQTQIQVINNKQNIKCICQTPDVTSIIADITQLLENQNVQLVFSEDGQERISQLKNWYEYMSIWTMIGLNIAYLLLLCVSHKLDKSDKSTINSILNIQNSVATTDEEQAISQKKNIKKKISVFLEIQMKKASEYINQNEEQVEKILFNTESKQQQLETQQILTDRNVFNKMYSQENEEGNGYQTTQRDQSNQQGSLIKLNQKQSSIFNQKESVFQNTLSRNKHPLDLQEFQQENYEKKEQNIESKGEKEMRLSYNFDENLLKESQSITNNKIVTIYDMLIKRSETQNKTEIAQNQKYDQISNIKNDQITNSQGIFLGDEINNNQINTGFMVDEIPFKFPQSPLNKDRHSVDIQQNSVIQITIENTPDKNDQNTQLEKQIQDQKQQQNNLQILSKDAKKYEKELEKKRKKQEIKEKKEAKQKKKQLEEQKKQNLKKEKKQKEIEKENVSRLKLVEYLNKEKFFISILAFHHLFQIFIIYNQNSVDFNIECLIWKELKHSPDNISQFSNNDNSLDYNILVAISGQDPEDSNKWIISYFITFALIELFFGIGICILMYYACKKVIHKVQTNTFLKFMGARPLLYAFSD
ncbi:hypothetical protein ABPG74_002748 [Tetrahymena malaccensis]